MPSNGGPPSPPASRAPVEHGAYGVVMITSGPKAGKFGYYDDDCPEGAIVYVDGPAFFSSYDVVPNQALGVATDAEARWWEATRNNERAMHKAAAQIKRRHRRRQRTEAPTVNTPTLFDAQVNVTIHDGKHDTYLKHDCRLPFAPSEGMTLFLGDARGDGEFVDVDRVSFYVQERKLYIDATVPEEEWKSLGNGKFRKIKQSEYIDRLKAAGFEIEYQFPAVDAKRTGRRRGGAKNGTPHRRRAARTRP
jgi:hypothetical protein